MLAGAITARTTGSTRAGVTMVTWAGLTSLRSVQRYPEHPRAVGSL